MVRLLPRAELDRLVDEARFNPTMVRLLHCQACETVCKT